MRNLSISAIIASILEFLNVISIARVREIRLYNLILT